MMRDLKVGDTVVVRRTGNAARNRVGLELFFTTTVTKTGRKYFELDFSRERFFIDDGMHDGKGYCQNYKVYKSMHEANESLRIEKNKDEIMRFNFSKMNSIEIYEVISVIKKHIERTTTQ